MTRHGLRSLALAVALLGAGCAPRVWAPGVTIIATSTPGVAYAVIRPDRQSESRTTASDYVLPCDARWADGVHCGTPVEAQVGDARGSAAPPSASVGTSETELPAMVTVGQ